ncbi:hypothetical protein DSO57_1031522 [Entomophthora muscae]|uniref:Uncharacterized protein n=1 Tax=Entomophthora muscae TaxID=34485 RepID=A0ACC2RFA7_9FUNG|nr:hypothetical protein DSO57_1031522 [Entomophthora muscae]
MSALSSSKKAKLVVASVKGLALQKDTPKISLKMFWEGLEAVKTSPRGSLEEAKDAFEEVGSDYFSRDRTPALGIQGFLGTCSIYFMVVELRFVNWHTKELGQKS